MSGHILILDGDILGVTSDMSYSQILLHLFDSGIRSTVILGCYQVIIHIGGKNYFLKDRKGGRCDFRSEGPIRDL